MDALPLHHAQIQPAWIDYNGHLRDAYYGLILSYAVDEVMDHLGLDAAYRQRTRCTLYTLELHMHYLHEVKGSDPLQVQTSVFDADGKRLHLGCRFTCGPSNAQPDAVVAATGEVMLLHVHQGDKPASAPFPAEIGRRLEALKMAPEAGDDWGPRSRRLELRRRAGK